MDIKPILSALRKHRLATFLIGLEIALACAVLCNACFLIAHRMQLMQINSGVEEASLGTIQIDGYEDNQAADLNARVVSGLRGIPGVQSVTLLNSIPFGRRRGTMGIFADPEQQHRAGVVEMYLGGPGSFEALGLHVVAGRKPTADDYQPFEAIMPRTAPVLTTRAFAERAWPGQDPLGKTLYSGESRYQVVGIVEHFTVPEPGGMTGVGSEWSVYVPGGASKYLAGSYLIKAAPGDIERVMRQAKDSIATIAPEAVLDQTTSNSLGDLRHYYFRQDRTMTAILVGVIFALLLVTALGIVGLASFWVQQRRKQIGIRRAIGATRGDILHYFQTENFLIVTGGIVVGMVMAYGLNIALMHLYELPRLPLFYLPLGAAVLWGLGQLAVLGPAMRAAAVPPVVATRSV